MFLKVSPSMHFPSLQAWPLSQLSGGFLSKISTFILLVQHSISMSLIWQCLLGYVSVHLPGQPGKAGRIPQSKPNACPRSKPGMNAIVWTAFKVKNHTKNISYIRWAGLESSLIYRRLNFIEEIKVYFISVRSIKKKTIAKSTVNQNYKTSSNILKSPWMCFKLNTPVLKFLCRSSLLFRCNR